MTTPFVVRRARPADAQSMAKVHVDTWRETYRGIVDDSVLDDPALLTWRETFWTAALTDERYSQNVAAVALHDGSLVGIAMAGPSLDDPSAGTALWVADPNPRAQAFYSKRGFSADGTFRVEDNVREIRMTRGT